MVEKKYIRTALTMAALATHNAIVDAQDDLRRESGQVCGFTVRATAREDENVGFIENNIAAINTTQNGLFYTSNQGGRLYNAKGDRCGFDPYLECSTDSESEVDRSPFDIADNGTITFQGQREFYLCARGAFQRCGATGEPEDCDTDSTVSLNQDGLGRNPRIYPPIGTTGNRQRNFENCTLTELVASQCFGDNGSGIFVPPSSALQSSSVPQQTGSVAADNARARVATMAQTNGVGQNGVKECLLSGAAIFAVLAFISSENWLV